jgi:hypothetical protein
MKNSTGHTPPQAPTSAGPSLPVAQPKQSKPGWQRATEVLLRSAHIVSMGLVLGGIAMGGTHETLLVPIVATVTSGLLLLTTCVLWGCLTFTQGAGWAILLKLAFLGLGNVFVGARLECYAIATFVTSIGSHMPSTWRHFTLPLRALPRAGRSGARAA